MLPGTVNTVNCIKANLYHCLPIPFPLKWNMIYFSCESSKQPNLNPHTFHVSHPSKLIHSNANRQQKWITHHNTSRPLIIHHEWRIHSYPSPNWNRSLRNSCWIIFTGADRETAMISVISCERRSQIHRRRIICCSRCFSNESLITRLDNCVLVAADAELLMLGMKCHKSLKTTQEIVSLVETHERLNALVWGERWGSWDHRKSNELEY